MKKAPYKPAFAPPALFTRLSGSLNSYTPNILNESAIIIATIIKITIGFCSRAPKIAPVRDVITPIAE